MQSLENLLSSYYQFTTDEIKFLRNNQKLICFIFDDMNDLDINLNFISELYNEFNASHYIFMGSLSKLKLAKNYLNLFTSQIFFERKKLSLLQEKTINLAHFSETTIRKYIHCFIEKNNDLALDYKEVDLVYQRIKGIQNLIDIVKEPISLMITMQVLPYLEKLYQNREIILDFESIQKDLYHIYIHLIYSKAAKKIEEKKGIIAINNISIYECILNYSIKLAQLMKQTEIREIDEKQIFLNKNYFPEIASTSASNEAELSKFTFSQHYEYIKLFSKKYTAHVFKDGDEFKSYKYGRQGCDFILQNGSFDNISYRFRHDKFLNYFFSLSYNIQDKERRNTIQKFMETYDSQKNKSTTHVYKKFETRASLKQARANFFSDTTKTLNYCTIMQEEPLESYPIIETSVGSSFEIV